MRKSIVLLACAGLLALTASAATARTGPVSRVPSPRAAAVMPANQASVQAVQAPLPADGFCLRLSHGTATTAYLCLLRNRPAEPGVGKCRRLIGIPDLVWIMGCRTS